MEFKNEAQLKKFLAEKCANAIENSKNRIHKNFSDRIEEFYSEFTPEEYIRTYALQGSLESTSVKRSGNQHMSSAKAEVYFNTPNYEQGVMPLQHTPEHGMYGYSSMSDEEIFDTVMTGRKPHGGYASGTAIWKMGMMALGGKNGIKNLIKEELKEQGL